MSHDRLLIAVPTQGAWKVAPKKVFKNANLSGISISSGYYYTFWNNVDSQRIHSLKKKWQTFALERAILSFFLEKRADGIHAH